MTMQSGVVFTKEQALNLIEIAILGFSQNGVFLRAGLYFHPTVDTYRLPRMIGEAMGLQIYTQGGMKVGDFILDRFIELSESITCRLMEDDFFLLQTPEKDIQAKIQEHAFDQQIVKFQLWLEYQSIEVLNKGAYDEDAEFLT